MPAIILVDEMFGEDCPNNADKRNSRWTQLEEPFKEAGTKACKGLLKDIDSARKIIRQNGGNKTKRKGKNRQEIEQNNDECCEKVPEILRDSKNLQNKFWCRATQKESPVPPDVKKSEFPFIAAKCFGGIKESFKKAMGVKRKHRKPKGSGTSHPRDTLRDVLPNADSIFYSLCRGGG
eukprot:CAMPEP_0113504924 /NCGR_PEP_ID=MMETSP0014_2-20120614/35000_1 /TAXON_ID=2857 /ORGANISM="Nitzschia sp." /LENGTH=177 /DNA_ID=CAMNT_0000400117 /DNA_START=171 /DNA_END=701 /DNA_ORIENTATION=+ /assembly_acc=CAM_ASM_000159